MADCSYTRCVQERRYIRRELAKWTKNMVHIVGLERVAEELMGRRKWKHYQDVLTRQQLNLPSVDEDDLLNSASVASSVASSAVPLTPSLVSAVGGNLLDQKGATTIVRNGHYQQDDELESKLASSNNQQVVAAAATSDKQAAAADHHQEAATAKQNHFNENDTRPTTTATATPPPSGPNATTVGTAGSVTLLNSSSSSNSSNPHHLPHHIHLLHQQQQQSAVETKKEKSDVCLQDHLQETGEDSSSTSTNSSSSTTSASREELALLATGARTSDKTATAATAVHSISSPALSSSSATTTTTALLSPATAASAVAELDERTKELVGKLAIKQEPAENQNNSSAAPEQSKLIRQENCNNLLNSKIIINNNNTSSATNNNNNNNNISSSELDGSGAPDGESPGGGSSNKQQLQSPRQPPTPVDWKPQDKCYFCVDGKLLTVNEAGELVPESGGGPAGIVPKAEVDLNQTTINESDSDSSDSSEPDLRAVLGRPATVSTKSLAVLLQTPGAVSQSMMDSMAQIAAAASLPVSSLAPFYNPLWYSQIRQQMSPSAAAVDALPSVSPPVKAERTSGLGPGGEQPLDLSAKPGTSGLNPAGLMMSMMDPKNIYKAKPRLSPIGGRRSYTEDELQNALQDILHGKLGTRRAAVLYGIPRSTLRNKVYKLAMEHKRELLQNISLGSLVEDDDDKDSIEDEAKDEFFQSKLNQQAIAEAYIELYQHNSNARGKLELPLPGPSTPPQQHRPTPEPPLLKPIQLQAAHPALPPQSSPLAAAAATSLIDPNLLLQLQSLLIPGGIPALANNAAHSKNPEEAAAAQAALAALPELLKKVIQQQELITEQIKKVATGDPRPSAASTPTLNNGPQIDPRLLPFLQVHQQHQQQQHSKPRTASGTPETTTSSMDLNDGGSDDSQVILKIPSYKPVPGSGPMPATAAALLGVSKNGDHQSLSTPSPPTGVPNVRDLSSFVSGSNLGAPGPSPNSSSISSGSSRPVHTASPQQVPPQAAAAAVAAAQQQAQNHLSVISPLRPRSTSQSPPSLLGSKPMLSINEVIARSISKNFQQHHQSDLLKQQMESMEQYKRPTISVIKNLGGTDISRFGSNPNITQIGSSQLGGTGTGGKGTRPKRGKYRNYDRDSLVEAVKAVQRGEMSVHRAGSYYGVPHSTLEYKVKERHLMRPRKREPKPQPGLDGIKSEFSTAGSSSVMRNMDKSKNQPQGGSASSKSQQQQQQQQQLKNQFPGTSPNGGLKMPMFDPAMASQLSYTSPFLWPHPTPAFPGLPMDFARQTSGPGTSTSGSSADNIFPSPMMQRFQEQQQQASKVSALSNSGVTAKTTRELAESIYDGTSTNGSLLDDIIRHSLDKKPGEMPHGALFDQLMKNNLRTSSSSSSSIAAAAASEEASAALLAKVGTKRSAASPLNFLSDNIKRERASPDASSPSSSGSSKPSSLPVGLAAFNDHHLQQQQQQQHHLQQQRHLNTSTTDSLLESHRAELLAKGNLAVENLIKLREDLTSMSVAHHQRTPMEDQHNGAEGATQHGKDDPSSASEQQQQQQHHHHHQQILSRRLVAKLPTDDSS